MNASVVVAAALAAAFALYAISKAPARLRTPMIVYNSFYCLTSAVGASVLANESARTLWLLGNPGLDGGWLDPGDTYLYWFLVWGPLVVTNWFALRLESVWRGSAVLVGRTLHMRPALLTCIVPVALMMTYCYVNLLANGYLSAAGRGLTEGVYQENILLRTEMFRTLGDLHYALIYMAIPAIVVVMFQRAVTLRSTTWGLAVAIVSAGLVVLYLATLTKNTILIFGLMIVISAASLGMIRARGIVLALAAGVLALSLLEYLLSGGQLLDLLRSGSNVLFRVAGGIPFYVEVFPAQVPYTGIDFGLGFLGIGPQVAVNQVIMNYMFPGLTWVQGAAPAPAQVMAYAQAGPVFALIMMGLVGALISIVGAFGRVAHSPIAFSAYVGGCIASYNASQTDFVGVFVHSYGYRWWIISLAAVAILEWALRMAIDGHERRNLGRRGVRA